ncbi:hypothetical protein JCM10212_003815 [Sporobolomyces blumeae]
MAQRLRPHQEQDQLITLETSLKQVKTLVDAGIGCITYLRGLFTEEAFEDCKLLAPRPASHRSTTTTTTADKDANGLTREDKPSSVRIKKLRRGGSSEGDKLLNYLDLGATEALEKGYLQQLVFAIYLDPANPTNLVESYTFSFSYSIDSAGNRNPEMTVQTQFDDLKIASTSTTTYPWTTGPRREGDVKRQVQQMIKNLITSTQLLDELPRRRFLNVRLYYNETAPPDYEPPYFRPLDENSPAYTLTTPVVGDVPDCSTLGSMQTGYHGVSLHSVSIAHVLQTAYDETLSKSAATEKNRQEALLRPVMWDAQALASRITDLEERIITPQPLGVTDPQGHVLTLELIRELPEMSDLRKRVGIEADENAVLVAKGDLEQTYLDSNVSDNENLRRAIEAMKPPAASNGVSTQLEPIVSRHKSYRPPVPLFNDEQGQPAGKISTETVGASEVAGTRTGGDAAEGDVEMTECSAFEEAQRTDLESVDRFVTSEKGWRDTDQFASQPVAASQLLEFSQPPTQPSIRPAVLEPCQPVAGAARPSRDVVENVESPRIDAEASIAGPASSKTLPEKAKPHVGGKRVRRKHEVDETACDCGDKDEDGGMVCCSGCDGWRHIACYGFERLDASIPDVFVCYRCRAGMARSESMFDPTREGEIDHALADLRSLALFRRAIVVVWKEGTFDSKALSHRLEVDLSTAAQVLRRLKAEEFLVEAHHGSSSRLRGNKPKSQGQRTRGFVVNKLPKQAKYKKQTYFSPGRGIEKPLLDKLLGLEETVPTNEEGATARSSHSISPEQTDSALSTAEQASDFAEAPGSSRVLVEATPSPAAGPSTALFGSQIAPPTQAQPVLSTINELEDPIQSASSRSGLHARSPSPIVDARTETGDSTGEECSLPLITPEQARTASRQAAARKPAKSAGLVPSQEGSDAPNPPGIAGDQRAPAPVKVDAPALSKPTNPLQAISANLKTQALTDRMDVDPRVPVSTARLPPSPRKRTRSSSNDSDGNDGSHAGPGDENARSGAGNEKGPKKAKRQKISEASEIEV